MAEESPQIERTKLAAGVKLEKEYEDLLKNVSGSVLDIGGGIGRIAEYLSTEKNCDVTLLEEERLNFSYRKNIVPNSKVKPLNISPSLIKLNKPCFDYVLIRGTLYSELAKNVARKAVIDITNMSITNVDNNPKVSITTPKAERSTGTNKKSETNNNLPVETTVSSKPADISSGESMESVE